MERPSRLPETRLASLYQGEGFGGETTMRARVIRELIDEIRALRATLDLDNYGRGSRIAETVDDEPATAQETLLIQTDNCAV